MGGYLAAKSRILVVEDEADLGELLVDLLSEDFDVDHCMDPREAMSFLRRQVYACLITDLAMPHMPGHQVVQATHAEFPQLPVIVMSGCAPNDPRLVAVVEIGCSAILPKPLPVAQDIVAAIKKAIATR